MNEKEQGRIKLLDKVAADNNKIKVSDAAKLCCGLIANYCEMTETGKKVKAKLTEDEYVSFMTGMCNSLLSSLYVSGAKTVKEQQERLEYVNHVNDDLLVGKKDLGAIKDDE